MNRMLFLLLVVLALSAGCAASGRRSEPQSRYQQSEEQGGYAGDPITASARYSAPASALVFDLPVAWDIPPLDLDRESRQPAAFIGYEGPSIEYHTVLINNSQNVGIGFGIGSSDNCNLGDTYQRQDLIERTSVLYR